MNPQEVRQKEVLYNSSSSSCIFSLNMSGCCLLAEMRVCLHWETNENSSKYRSKLSLIRKILIHYKSLWIFCYVFYFYRNIEICKP